MTSPTPQSYMPGAQPPTGPAGGQQPRRPNPTPWIIAGVSVVVAVIVVFAITFLSLGDDEPVAAPSATAPTAAAAAPEVTRDEVMCTNVQRAYNAWDTHYSTPKAAGDVLALSKPEMGWAMDEGGKLADATTGYEERGSKGFAVTVAQYNVDLAFANTALVLGGSIGEEEAVKVADSAQALRRAFGTWFFDTCS